MLSKFLKNRIIITGALLFSVSMLLTGCGNAIIELTPEEQQRVCDYATFIGLSAGNVRNSRLVEDYEEITEEVPEEIPEEVLEPEVQMPEVAELDNQVEIKEPENQIPVIDVSNQVEEEVVTLEECLGMPEGMSAIYKGYSWASSYPDDGELDSFFSLDASAGKKFLVIHYTFVNQSGADQLINILESGQIFKALIEGAPTKTALITMLKEDMSTFMDTIPDGGSSDVVLLFEEDASIDEYLSSLQLNVKSNDHSIKVSLE